MIESNSNKIKKLKEPHFLLELIRLKRTDESKWRKNWEKQLNLNLDRAELQLRATRKNIIKTECFVQFHFSDSHSSVKIELKREKLAETRCFLQHDSLDLLDWMETNKKREKNVRILIFFLQFRCFDSNSCLKNEKTRKPPIESRFFRQVHFIDSNNWV